METNFGELHPDHAAESLDALRSDRESLAAGTRVSRPLLAAYGGVAAWFVAAAAGTQPGSEYHAPPTAWLALVAALVISYLVQRETGIRFRAMGAGAFWAVIGILALCLGLYSASLALVSLGATWAVSLASVLAFAGTALLAGVAYRSALTKIRRG